MSIKAKKYDPFTNIYTDVLIPDECSSYETDMEKEVVCASCGKKLKYGDTYCSREIHTKKFGFGYGVCQECYTKETERYLLASGILKKMEEH